MYENAKKASRTLWIALLANCAVAIAKTLYGIFSGTLSMIADGLHSIADAGGSLIGLISVNAAQKPSDRDHHYGHHKYETLAALGIGAFIGLATWEILKSAVDRFSGEYHPSFHYIGIVIMMATMAINAALSLYERAKGKELKSPILIADAYHTGSDFFVSLSVLASLLFIKFELYWADAIVSIVIAIYLAYIAFRIVRENVLDLSDAAFIDTVHVQRIVRSVPGILYCHHVRTRGREGKAFVDLHIQVDPAMDTYTSHTITHIVEERIKDEINGIRDVIIHTEPYPDRD